MRDTRHLFVIDPLEDLNLALDTSLRLAKTLFHRKCHIYTTSPSQMRQDLDSGLATAAQTLRFAGSKEELLCEPGEAAVLPINHFDAIHIRKDPPTDEYYWVMTWLLSTVPKNILQFNRPEAIRNFNEKLLILNYPQYTDPALVSCDEDAIFEFIQKSCGGDAVIKPLMLFGGQGVARLSGARSDEHELRSQIQESTGSGRFFRIVQPFNPAIADGEIRVFCAGGEPITWCLKRPKPGEFLANTARGATLSDMTPSKKLDDMVRHVAQDLLQQGLFFIGFDIIGDRLSEINVTSPRLLSAQLSQCHFDSIATILEKQF